MPCVSGLPINADQDIVLARLVNYLTVQASVEEVESALLLLGALALIGVVIVRICERVVR